MMNLPVTSSPEIVAIGEALVEFSAAEEGTLAAASHFTAGSGGDTSNFAVAVSRLGGRAGYISRLGSDPFAEVLFKCWETEGVDCSRVARDEAACTGIYFTARQGTQHQFTYYRRDSAASRMQPGDLPVDYIQGARWLHVSGISQAISTSAARTVAKAVGIARQAGLMISYDPNLRLQLWSLEAARDGMRQLANQVDVLLPSYEDACQLTGEKDPELILRHYLDQGPRLVVLKMGAEGALLAERLDLKASTVNFGRFPGHAVAAVDASGAGDTFDAALAVAICENRPLAECVRFANAAGALVTTGVGAVTPIPFRAAVAGLMRRQAGKEPSNHTDMAVDNTSRRPILHNPS